MNPLRRFLGLGLYPEGEAVVSSGVQLVVGVPLVSFYGPYCYSNHSGGGESTQAFA